jgi:mannose-6-phosphate isomerase
MRPIVLGSNRPARFYRGGPRIDAFRGEPVGDLGRPEDWVASTTTLFGLPDAGLTRIGSRTLRDLVLEDPLGWLGVDHRARLGPDPGLLVKLLAADERLPVHAHPDRAFAMRWLGSRWGKTEAWVILDAGPSGEVWLGWRSDVEAEELLRAVLAQDAGSMLQRMNRISVEAGDSILVPAGTVHAIGPGMLVLELQEPSDLSVILEWQGFAIDVERDGRLGLGLDVALGSVGGKATSAVDLDRLVVRSGAAAGPDSRLLPPAADPFFRAETVRGGRQRSPAGFGVLVVTSGEGRLESTSAAPIEVRAGMTLVLPAAASPWQLNGPVDAIWCGPGADADDVVRDR